MSESYDAEYSHLLFYFFTIVHSRYSTNHWNEVMIVHLFLLMNKFKLSLSRRFIDLKILP